MANILVLDDDAQTVFLLSEFLSLDGHTVLKSTDPKDALTRIEKASIDLAVVDFNMPNLKGTEFLKAMRSKLKSSRVPVILMSGQPPADLAGDLMGQAKVKFMPKPIEFDALAAAIKDLLR